MTLAVSGEGQFTLVKKVPAHIALGTGWAPEPVLKLKKKNPLLLPEIEPGLSSLQPIAVPTKLSWLPNFSNGEYLIFLHIF
jgi:hypothetical protein